MYHGKKVFPIWISHFCHFVQQVLWALLHCILCSAVCSVHVFTCVGGRLFRACDGWGATIWQGEQWEINDAAWWECSEWYFFVPEVIFCASNYLLRLIFSVFKKICLCRVVTRNIPFSIKKKGGAFPTVLTVSQCEILNWCGMQPFRRRKNTIKAGGSTVRAQNVDWVMDGWSGWYPLDCYDY